MTSYHRHLKWLLDFAIEERNDRAVKYAVARLEKTGVPKLAEYAHEKMRTYHTPAA